jgi:hypothetical protein
MMTHNVRQLQEICIDRVLEKLTPVEGNSTSSQSNDEFLARSRGALRRPLSVSVQNGEVAGDTPVSLIVHT